MGQGKIKPKNYKNTNSKHNKKEKLKTTKMVEKVDSRIKGIEGKQFVILQTNK